MVQVSPTGFSAFVDPDGNVSQRTDVSERAVIEADVERLDGTTPAQALGDVPPSPSRSASWSCWRSWRGGSVGAGVRRAS